MWLWGSSFLISLFSSSLHMDYTLRNCLKDRLKSRDLQCNNFHKYLQLSDFFVQIRGMTNSSWMNTWINTYLMINKHLVCERWFILLVVSPQYPWGKYFYFPSWLRKLKVKERLNDGHRSELESASLEVSGLDSRDPRLQFTQLWRARHSFWRPKNTCLLLFAAM